MQTEGRLSFIWFEKWLQFWEEAFWYAKEGLFGL